MIIVITEIFYEVAPSPVVIFIFLGLFMNKYIYTVIEPLRVQYGINLHKCVLKIIKIEWTSWAF